MIRAQDLRKSFGAERAVDGVSFEIRPGETFGLLGPNGAGKTTTILMLAGALRPDAGRILVGDSGDPTTPQARKQLGIAPQALALYEELNGEENLRFYGKIYGVEGKRLQERVEWALELAGLQDKRKVRMSTYSGGMKRRLNLACALVHDPPVIFLDEPTVGVDPQSRNHIFESIESLKSQGRTILYTTHYMEEAARLCDRVAIMDKGRILAMDTVDGLIQAHGGLSVIEAELEKPLASNSPWAQWSQGTRWRQETDKPLEQAAALATSGVKLLTLKVERPDLEVVFLRLTGRRLRD